MNEKIINVAEELGWHVHEENGEYVDFAQFSPAGEDFSFTVSANNIVKEVRKYADGFDADEHAELWLDSRGKGGCPSTIRELINDADAIKTMVQDLATALEKIEDKGGGKNA